MVVFGGLALLITWLDAWANVADWFTDQSVVTLTVALPLAAALIATLAALPGIRRVVPDRAGTSIGPRSVTVTERGSPDSTRCGARCSADQFRPPLGHRPHPGGFVACFPRTCGLFFRGFAACSPAASRPASPR
ncbi:hypothetical protein [Blastococcus goldschmidtiae]|uniref:Uncharacterized protein n=1 Tax=Blastococcus goldschmidtiae TaxID=3075546 RepID=A0ABU2KDC4_9ACTN|nr:hypothetical protein [Blastococcus sp. DSM 46792]MDT0278173.1 hypothetical protein [Blastococcus sp. DSM 46792]